MQTDSDIIYFTTKSLRIDSAAGAIDRQPHPPSSSSSDISFCHKLKHECKTFWCFVCFLTCKSFKYYTPKMYLILLSLMILSSSMISGGFMSAILKSLQTQFNLSTSKVGLILSSYDIMNVFATPIVSYLGTRFNKARLISICAFFYCIGTIVFIMPYLVGPKYTISIYGSSLNNSVSQYDYCFINNTNYDTTTLMSTTTTATASTTTSTITDKSTTISISVAPNATSNSCSRENGSAQWPYYIFIIGQLLMSLGSSPVFALGITYLCDNLEEHLHAFYTGNNECHF